MAGIPAAPLESERRPAAFGLGRAGVEAAGEAAGRWLVGEPAAAGGLAGAGVGSVPEAVGAG
ncbi:MAG: thioester domain-containing protein, partial [Candidatus Dormibacteraceae bacterium]